MKPELAGKGLRHGLRDGAYFNDFAAERYRPYLRCLCGRWESSRSTDSWEDAGRELDYHLYEMERLERMAELMGADKGSQ